MKETFVARQPIFDDRQRVVAYELLYRGDHVSNGTGPVTDESMSSSVLVDGVLGMGFKRLTEGQVAFINMSGQMLMDGVPELLDPKTVVLEILETVEPTPELVARCQALVAQGYRFALDDFVFEDRFRPLLELAEFVKIDVTAPGRALSAAVEIVTPFNVKLLAEKVENKEMHDECVRLGFQYFQGFHYFRPETMTRKDASAQSLAIVRLMNMLQDDASTERSLEETFRSDPALTYKLLRIVNSAALGGRGIQSIPHALRLLGREPLYRWLCLLLLATGEGGGDVRIEIIKASLLRGRMSELLGDMIRGPIRRDVPSGGAMFLIGLFAQIDQLLGAPVEEILADIDVTQEVRDALLHRGGPGGMILKATEAYVEAQWEDAEEELQQLGGNTDVLPEIYLDALTWAGAMMAVHAEDAAA